ncbi:hypothetical protein [Hymenobacter sp. BRD67]|uniref:hypothetical protein n=1 Tax=Hymenobacter sp. BRD67 TaxID=2675877 RepID=UPI00156384F3|nr:hypothetical protein [Hymenobacter sp. BRD67]QKG55070.1 hypothetical protein GKZ67_21850 [Hymenobacter sp. BRD67]
MFQKIQVGTLGRLGQGLSRGQRLLQLDLGHPGVNLLAHLLQWHVLFIKQQPDGVASVASTWSLARAVAR